MQSCIFITGEQQMSDVCSKDPCQNIARAVVGSCQPQGDANFVCRCQHHNKWDDDTNACISGEFLLCKNAKIEIKT